MFEFFIALFGGLFYAGKYSNEKSKLRDFEMRQKSWELTLDNIESRYAASYELERWAKDFISSGENIEDIYNWFADDFRYVFGDDWKTKLTIPTPSLPMWHIYGKRGSPWLSPSAHVMWVYHLLLAKNGKIDHWAVTSGFPIGGINEKDMNVKFAECIERQLMKAGVQGVRLGLELGYVGTYLRAPTNLCGGDIKIESLCNYPTHRLW